MRAKRIGMIFALALIAPLAFSQATGRGKIRGVVIDGVTRQPLPGVTVKLFNESLGTYHNPSPVTDKKGEWGAYFLKTGIWNLEFEKVGYVTQPYSYRVSFNPGALKDTLLVSLRPIKDLVVTESIVSKIGKADKLFAEGKYEDARKAYEALLAEDPNVYILHKNIGNTYFVAEDFEKAMASYMKVYEKQNDRADVLAAIAHCHNNLGRKEEASLWYQKIPFDEIRDIDTAYNAGVNLYNGGQVADAEKYFRKAIEIDPEFADGYYQLGMASVAQSKNAEAIEALETFLKLAPDSPQAAAAQAVLAAIKK